MLSNIFGSNLAGAGIVVVAALFTYVFVARSWHLKWGAEKFEADGPLPGDELVPYPQVRSTHAITIKARAADVWPWLLQMGQGRGGFYSYTWLENLVGCQMRNAERIVPEWQDLRVGDGVSLHPKAPPLPVVAIEPGRSIVLGCSWAFVLHPIDERTTRLIVRSQGVYQPDMGNAITNFLIWRVVYEPAHFVMERKMLLGIKSRAEAWGTREQSQSAAVAPARFSNATGGR